MQTLGIVLAGGQGKRMKSKLYKVLHPVCGMPMVGHVVSVLEKLQVQRMVVVVGHGAEAVRTYLGDRSEYALQAEQLGTGHAALQAKDIIGTEEGCTIVVCGDTPLVTEQSLRQMTELHKQSGAAATIMTAETDNPFGYGRIVRENSGSVSRIVEQKDCTPEEARIREFNTGTYCFDNRKLFAALALVKNDNVQNEYYLTDVIGILQRQGEHIEAYLVEDNAEAIGVNDRVALAEAERLMRERINRFHMVNGVSFIDPTSTYIEANVKIGADTVLYPGTIVKGDSSIGEGCSIGPNTELGNCKVGDGAAVKHSVANEAIIGKGTQVGPFANLRPGSVLGEDVKIGDFVEIKNAQLGDGSKVSHLSYVGDARIGKNVNFGCGAITVNYDGYNKHWTEVEDDAFIGSNVNLVAPVTIGKGAFVVAGSTITQNVDENALAIARERQTNKPEYAEKIRGRAKAMKAKKQQESN